MLELVARIQSGDRGAAAQFMQRFGERIRCRVRAQLGRSMRRLFDSQDILSTVARRLDELVCSGSVRASTEDQLLGLLMRITSNAVVDKARLIDRLREASSEDLDVAQTFHAALERRPEELADDGGVIERAFAATSDPVDRTVLSLWLNGYEHATIAVATGLSAEAVRFRWHRLKGRLRERLAPHLLEDSA